MKASDYKPDQRIFAMFVARSGDGKSTAAASFPGPVMDLDFDNRFAGIAGAIEQKIYPADGIEYTPFNPRGGWDPVDKMLQQWEMWRISGQFPYKTVIIDSLTSFTRLLVVASHKAQQGKMIGNLRVSGPGDFNFEAAGTHQFFDYLRTFPCNVICSAHIVDKYGKLNKNDQYSETGIIGEKLSIRDNLGENVQTYFDDVYRFERRVYGGKTQFSVNFSTDLAKNKWGIPPGDHDITGKNFYQFLQEKIKETKK